MRRWHQLGGFLLTVATLWLSLHLHSRTGRFNYKSEIFADKAGYYSYLPATFVFGWEAAAIHDTLPDALGGGFFVNDEGKIFTKYPIGVAVMQAPFFMGAHYVAAPLLGEPRDGFSVSYHKAIDIAAWVYLLLGLLLMAKVLAEYFSPRIVWATLLAFFLGTNLLYYYAVESGMSHVYSFFLMSALLRLVQLVHRREEVSWGLGLALGAVAGLLVITRFTNVLLLSAILFWEARTIHDVRERVSILFRSRGTRAALIVPALLIGLQVSYYLYLSGKPWLYAYGDEHFDFLHPHLLKVWFSPHNGLLPYAPALLLGIVGVVIMWRRKIPGAVYIAGIWMLASYVFSCWWQWYFGCAYGGRSFVEYLPLLMVAGGYTIEWIGERPKAWRITAMVIICLVVLIATKNAYLYKLCYLGNGNWDWAEWWKLVAQW